MPTPRCSEIPCSKCPCTTGQDRQHCRAAIFQQPSRLPPCNRSPAHTHGSRSHEIGRASLLDDRCIAALLAATRFDPRSHQSALRCTDSFSRNRALRRAPCRNRGYPRCALRRNSCRYSYTSIHAIETAARARAKQAGLSQIKHRTNNNNSCLQLRTDFN